MLGRDCQDCPLRVAGGLLPADLCAFPAVPVLLWPWDWKMGHCNLRRSLKADAKGLRVARRWVRRARNLSELFTLAFRGVKLSQVCVSCEGQGIDVEKEASVPLWQRACPACDGRGFTGERDLGEIPRTYTLKQLDAPAKFRKFFEDHLAEVSAGSA